MTTILWLIWSLRISYADYSDLDHESLYPWYVTLDHTFLRLLIFGRSIAGRALFTLMVSKLSTAIAKGPCTVDSNKTEQGCRMILAGFASSFGLRMEEGQVPTFWLLLEVYSRHLGRKWVAMFILWAPAMYSHGTQPLGVFLVSKVHPRCTRSMKSLCPRTLLLPSLPWKPA